MKMNISNLVYTKTWKNFMSKVYGWGASIVLLGAMFKIMHWPGSGIMLVVGLGTEAFIFFMSAFEPLHEDYDWALVYPELAGIEKDIKSLDNKNHNLLEKKLSDIFESTENGADIFIKIREGLEKLATTSGQLSDLTDATIATKEYVNNIKQASESVINFSKIQNGSLDKIKDSGMLIADKVSEIALKMSDGLDYSEKITRTYSCEMKKLTEKITEINSLYEIQINHTSEQLDQSKIMLGGLLNLTEKLAGSMQNTEKYGEEMSNLARNLSALNTIYRNMLMAMNINLLNK